MTETVFANHLFDGERTRANVALSFRDGVITAVRPDQPAPDGPRRLIIPALVNAHDHARPAMASFGAGGMPLETWILRAALATPPDAYLAAAVALARSARAGCGGLMIHYTRPSGRMDIVAEAGEIARAAHDVGIRMAFALAVRDQNPLTYGDSAAVLASLPPEAQAPVAATFMTQPLTPAAYLDLIDAIDAAIAGPLVDVQYGPAGVQWCSEALLEAIAARSAITGRRVHMHLLETVCQRAWADERFPQGVVRYLRDIGLLSERLTLAHCIHARPDELEMIAASGATIVTNFSSNLHLHSGMGPIASAHRCGCRVAVGVDGVALDEDDDAIREHRLVQLAHDGVGFDRTWGRGEFLALATHNGRRSLGAPGTGAIRPGAPADFVMLDFDRLDRDQIMPVDPLDLLFARANMACVRDVTVAGRRIVANGKPQGVDLDAAEAALRRMYRERTPTALALQAAWPQLEDAARTWFAHNCCG